MIETLAPETFAPCDFATLVAQIGRGNVLAISGGRTEAILRVVEVDGEQVGERIGVRFPVHAGYRVDVLLAADDTYTVRRVFERGSKRWVKGERVGVYCDEVGEAAYQASCYVNVDFGGHVVE